MLIEESLLRKQKEELLQSWILHGNPALSTGNILVKRDVELQHEKTRPPDKAGFVKKGAWPLLLGKLVGFRIALDTQVSEVLLWHKDLCLSAAQGRRLPSTSDTDLGNDQGLSHHGIFTSSSGAQNQGEQS